MSETASNPFALPPARVVRWLSFSAIPVAAALGFVVQPIMGKLLLPRLGGTAATWLGASLFFQCALLLGYGWGLWLARRAPRTQLVALAVLSSLAVLTFHAPAGLDGAPTILGVMGSLAASCLPAMVLLFGLSPWLHSWRERLSLPEPYALYAISNGGSLLAVLLYPLWIETTLGLEDQLAIWRSFLFLVGASLIAGVFVLGKGLGRHGEAANAPTPLAWPESGLTQWATWIGLSALTCAMMLGATQLIAAEIGSSPIAWTGPLGVYLASYALVFSGRWRTWMTGSAVVVLGLALAGFMATKGFGSATIDGARLGWLVLACASGSLVGNALIHDTRPKRGGEWFYLALALGGALGGLVSLLIVPAVFPRPVEFAVGSAVLLATGLCWGCRWTHPGAVVGCLALALGPVFILGMGQANADRLGTGKLAHYRDLYGHLMVKTDPVSVVLSSGTTTHGTQLTETDASRRQPTLYYTESSAVGRVIERLQSKREALRVAVVGLGAGTLAAYNRPTDHLVFYDIDPKVEQVARHHFTYLADARGTVRVELQDGRHALAAGSEDLDLIVLDAFMGDGVPGHLMTREALGIYQNRLRARQGLLVIHATLRYSRLFPIVGATARTLDLEPLEIVTDIHRTLDNRDWDPARSIYLVIGTPAQAAEFTQWFPVSEDEDRVTREITRITSLMVDLRGIWTDDRESSMDVLDLSKLLSPQ
jgi:hypothetical protein